MSLAISGEPPRPSVDGRADNLVGSAAVPLLLQLGLSGAIKIFGPAAPTAESGPQHRVAFDLYALAVLLTFAFDMLLAIYVIAFSAGFAAYNKPLAAVITKALISVALAVSFSTAVFGTVLNILI